VSTRRGWQGLFWLTALAASIAVPHAGAQESEPGAEPTTYQGGDVTIGGHITVERNEVRHGDIQCIGGTARIDGRVEGDVNVIAGHLEVRGTVDGDVNAIATRSTLHDGARIEGEFHNIGGTLQRGRAEVLGEVVNIGPGFSMPGLGWLGAIGSFFVYWALLELLLIFLMLLVLCALVPERVRLVSDETPVRWPGALLAGIAGYAALPILVLLLLFSILGIPLIPLVWCVFFVFKTLALAGVFHLVGSRIGRSMGREMSLLGAVLLGFVPFALVRLVFSALGFPVSFLGWLFIWMPLQVVAVGLMILTRGGGRRPAVPSPVPVVAPAPAIPTTQAPEP
jgi:hypothetical protein